MIPPAAVAAGAHYSKCDRRSLLGCIARLAQGLDGSDVGHVKNGGSVAASGGDGTCSSRATDPRCICKQFLGREWVQ